MSIWERVVDGEGQAVLIVGEAGIGKSRLLHHFREQIAPHSHAWLESGAVPFFQNTPFYAVTDMLQQSFHWKSADSAERRLAALEASLATAGIKLDEAVPLIAWLLELPVDGKYRLRHCHQTSNVSGCSPSWLRGYLEGQRLSPWSLLLRICIGQTHQRLS